MHFKKTFLVFPIFLLTGCHNIEMIDFKKMKVNTKPNNYLVCPQYYCNITPNAIAKSYPVNVNKLQTAWQNMVTQEPRVRLVESVPAEHKYQYVQYSRVFHFPDYIDVQFIPITETSSTLAVYSRARYGYYDFHVNENRVKKWLAALTDYFK